MAQSGQGGSCVVSAPLIDKRIAVRASDGPTRRLSDSTPAPPHTLEHDSRNLRGVTMYLSWQRVSSAHELVWLQLQIPESFKMFSQCLVTHGPLAQWCPAANAIEPDRCNPLASPAPKFFKQWRIIMKHTMSTDFKL